MAKEKDESKLTDFSNITRNPDAQKFLLENAGKMSAEELRAEILKRQGQQSEVQMEKRDTRRAFYEKVEGQYDSFLDTKDKEKAMYEKLDAHLANEAISWVEQEIKKREQKENNLGGGGQIPL